MRDFTEDVFIHEAGKATGGVALTVRATHARESICFSVGDFIAPALASNVTAVDGQTLAQHLEMWAHVKLQEFIDFNKGTHHA